MVRRLFFAVILGIAPLPAAAETAEDFIRRIEAAYAAPDKAAALRALYYFEGMDDATRQMYEDRIIGRHMMKIETPAVLLEPLPGDFNPLQVGGGFEYRPNLEPLGYVVLNGKTRALYGRHGETYYLAGVIRTPVTDPVGAEVMLQMIVMGFGSPQIRFAGYCDLLLANGNMFRAKLSDEGQGSRTMLVTGVKIQSCELKNQSDHGSMKVLLLEGDNRIFENQVDHPETLIVFPN